MFAHFSVWYAIGFCLFAGFCFVVCSDMIADRKYRNSDEGKWRRMQEEKNKTGVPRYVLNTYPADIVEEDELVSAWIKKWENDFLYFKSIGCGCCVNIYEFDASPAAMADLSVGIEVYPYQQRP